METAASYGSAVWGSVSSLIVLLGVFLPEIAILAGFLSDLMNVRVRHMPTSAFGVLASVLNWIVALFIGPKPENASFFSLPARNMPSYSSAASMLSSVGKLFSPPATLLGVASPLGSQKSTSASTSNPTNTVRQAATTAIATVTPAIPQIPDGSTPHGNPADDDDDRVTVQFSRNRRRPASYAPPGDTAWDRGSAFPPNPSVLNGRGRGQTGGGAKLADMVNGHFNPCAVRGLGTFDVAKRPMGIAVLTTIFFIYLLDMSVNKKRTTNEQISYWAVASGVIGVNIYAYWTLGCVDSILSVAVPLIIGLVVGGSAFAIYQKLGPSYLPMDAEAPSSALSSVAPTGEYSACASGNGGDFVCDAYLNGERIGTVGAPSSKP